MLRRAPPSLVESLAVSLIGCVSSAPSRGGSETLTHIELSDEIVCEDPSLREASPFVRYEEGDWLDRPESGGAWGLAVGDFNRDGWLDLFVPTVQDPRLYLGGPDGYLDATHQLPPEALVQTRAATTADFDGDGDLDVFTGSRGYGDFLLVNDGSAHFEARALPPGATTLGSSWGDVDGDGDLDLAIAKGISQENRGLFLQQDGVFEARMDLLPELWFQGHTFLLSFVDVDGDGDLDLYRGNDVVGGHGNLLALNDGTGRFTADDGSRGLNIEICTMGLGLGDLNGDEIADLAMTDCTDLVLMESNAGGIWVDHSASRELTIDPARAREVPWGVELADLDHDGALDAYIGYGWLQFPTWHPQPEQYDGLYVQQDDGTFAEVSEAWGVADETGQSRGFVLADLNNDGWLDIARQDMRGTPRIYHSQCGNRSWLRLTLDQGEGPNRYAVGAKVVVEDREQRQTRWVTAGGTSVASGGPPEIHVGLGIARTVDIEVTWPDGERQRWERVPTRRMGTLLRDR